MSSDVLRERVRERLVAIIEMYAGQGDNRSVHAADAILREFALRPVAVGTVGEGGEVKLGTKPASPA